ncbi:transposase [Bradyrhizobium sp. 6(2017)]|uniref:transposase n=1 Tax=Bradyrhizobium sp. 6(2017) TaxID=1197460 RepID=UPI0013E1867B|nr:transposase [Bradyrhizobium sp. 6(2017)]QIG97900.1 transposase [Bradyrhizobium sp. 6(2017)]
MAAGNTQSLNGAPLRKAPGLRASYLAFYNRGRPHSSLDERTPDEAYFGAQTMVTAA